MTIEGCMDAYLQSWVELQVTHLDPQVVQWMGRPYPKKGWLPDFRNAFFMSQSFLEFALVKVRASTPAWNNKPAYAQTNSRFKSLISC